MNIEGGELYFARRAVQELDLAAASGDPAVKATHLNMAARYATLRERSARIESGSGSRSDVEPADGDR